VKIPIVGRKFRQVPDAFSSLSGWYRDEQDDEDVPSDHVSLEELSRITRMPVSAIMMRVYAGKIPPPIASAGNRRIWPMKHLKEFVGELVLRDR